MAATALVDERPGDTDLGEDNGADYVPQRRWAGARYAVATGCEGVQRKARGRMDNL